jgi:hypothetical protein
MDSQTLFLKYCLKYCRTTSSAVSRREAIRNPSLDQNHNNCWMKVEEVSKVGTLRVPSTESTLEDKSC